MRKERKKIAIVTWLDSKNYGTSLQAFALYRKLQDLGYDSFLLRHYTAQQSFRSIAIRLLGSLGLIKLIIWLKSYRDSWCRKVYIFQKEFETIKAVYTSKQLTALQKKTCAFISGSDQIWNAWYNFDPFYFLNFAGNVKRIAYASSIGTKGFPRTVEKEIKKLLEQFAYIGVREITAKEYLNSLLGVNYVVQVVDPTFLLSAKEWERIMVRPKTDLPDRYIFAYLIGNNTEYLRHLETVRNKSGITDIVYIVPAEEDERKLHDSINVKGLNPLEFVYLIKSSSLVCTDSFHATALSINLSKEFVEFLRFSKKDVKSQNSRIFDLLGKYNLNSRVFNSQMNLSKIDYNRVQKILLDDRAESLDFLLNAIEK